MPNDTEARDFEIEWFDLNNHQNAAIIDRDPDTCPICKKGIEAKRIVAHGRTSDMHNFHEIQMVYKCPRKDCQALFVGFFSSAHTSARDYSINVFLRDYFVPFYYEKEEFEEEIADLSPKFERIFNQVQAAEAMELDEICGLGYRKALEFLIKDFVILTHPDSKEEVEDNSLGWVIFNKIENDEIKSMAGLAKDVGNDETHYIKKIEELGVEDLKELIRLTTSWITYSLRTKKYKTVAKEIKDKDKASSVS